MGTLSPIREDSDRGRHRCYREENRGGGRTSISSDKEMIPKMRRKGRKGEARKENTSRAQNGNSVFSPCSHLES